MSYLEEKTFQFWILFFVVLVGFFWLFHPIMAPFIVGFAVAYLLNPVVGKMEKRRFPRWLSALLILGLFFIVLILALILAVPLLVREMIDFIKLMPVAFENAREWLITTFPGYDIPQSLQDVRDLDTDVLSERLGSVVEFSKNLLGNIFRSGIAVIGFVAFLTLMPIVAFYLLIDWPRLVGKIDSLLPEKKAGRIKIMLSEIDDSLAGFIRGQLMVCSILGGFYAIALTLLGLDYGFFVGVAAGLLSIIPYVGSIFGLVASVGLAFYQFGGWEYPLAAFMIFIVGQLIEGNYLTPKLVGDSIGLHPLWVIFALMAGGMLLGLLGMMIAVPVAAILAVLIRHAIDIYKHSAYFKGGH